MPGQYGLKDWPVGLTCVCGYNARTIDEVVAHQKGTDHLQMRLALQQITTNDYRLEMAIRKGKVFSAA